MTRKLSRIKRREMARRIASARRIARRKLAKQEKDINALHLHRRIAQIRNRLEEMEVEQIPAKRMSRVKAAATRVASLRRLLRRAERDYSKLRNEGAEVGISDHKRTNSKTDHKEELLRRRYMLAKLRRRRQAFALKDKNAPPMIRRRRDGKLFMRSDLD